MSKKRFDWAQRLKKLPPYLFAEIDKEKKYLKSKGIDFIDLSIGDPDILAPIEVVNTLSNAARLKPNQKYALDQGKFEFRKTIKNWFKDRFAVGLDENKEILPLIGSKEGLVHLPLGFVDSGDYVIIPSPGYPGYRGAALFAGAGVYEMPLLEKNNFLPDLEKIPRSVRNRAKIIYLNYPNNPTTVLAPVDFLKKLVSFASKYGIIIAYDNAYSELYFNHKPKSILEIKGAKEVSIEFHSLSKTFCMTGFRVGWACGNKELVETLLKVKTNIDSGIFGAIQDAASFALEKENHYANNLRKTIKERRDIFVKGLMAKGYKDIFAESTFYVWVRIPQKYRSAIDFSKTLLTKRIVAAPGRGFGKWGEGFVRFALTVDKRILEKAIDLL
ncbi:MAG: aminotransferase class I/II-fold pyridoxal phosphate-dependent enzyme [Candidatus Omnitrophota bacterium]|nr:MAG: aminotransferase class I/II-fold pyridoxal phosphate-dependent enzyme [Candidatus Omnitrophota bacterium]